MKGGAAQTDWEQLAEETSERGRNDRRVSFKKCFKGLKLVSLKDALEDAQVPNSSDIATQCVANAKEKRPDGADVLSYVYAYTYDFGDAKRAEENPYARINRALLIGTDIELNPIKNLFYGLLFGLRTLKYKKFDKLYRGLKNQVDWGTEDEKYWPSFTSTSKNIEKAKAFLDRSEPSTPSGTLITVVDAWGYDLQTNSLIENEEEVLIEPGIRVIVDFAIPGTPDTIIEAQVSVVEGSGDLLLEQVPRCPYEDEGQEDEPDARFAEYDRRMRLGDSKEAAEILKDIYFKDRNLRAAVKYGLMLTRGNVVEKNLSAGLQLLKEGRKYKDGEGLYILGRYYEMGIETERNVEKAMGEYMFSFLRGYCVEMEKLIRVKEVLDGKYEGELKNEYRFVKDMLRGGSSHYQYIYGVCCVMGLIDKEDVGTGMEMLRKSCDKGNDKACYYMASCYTFGIGVEKNPEEAFKYYKLAAEKENALAQYNLGYCYKKGIGVEENLDKAVELYTLSAGKGNAHAQCNLGLCYKNGDGVEKDLDKARELYERSAEQGNSHAQCNLGLCYKNAIGVEKNVDKAKKYYKQSADQGNEHAKAALETLEKS